MTAAQHFDRDRPPSAAVQVSDRPIDRSASTVPGERRSDLLLALVCAAVTGLALHLRLGYQIGTGDQQVLMIRGLAAADPTAFLNDWFDAAAPQPHWSFDVVTYLGERLGALPGLYFGYWLASLAAFGLATAWLARRWLPDHARWLATLVGPALVLSPISIMGSTTPLLAWALPHVLGGCLAYLTLAALLTDRPLPAAIAALATSVAHVQHGANLAVILVASAVLLPRLARTTRAVLLATAGAIVSMSVAVTRIRGIVGNGDDFLEICNDVVPFHCQATQWPSSWFVDGAILGLLLVALLASRWGDDGRRLLAPIALPAAGLFLGVYADWADLGALGELAQRTNIYRLVALLMPFAAWAIVGGVAFAVTSRRRAALVSVAVGVVSIRWFTGFTAPFEGDTTGALIAASLLTTAVLAARFVVPRRLTSGLPALSLVPALVVLLVLVPVSDVFTWRPLDLAPSPSDPTEVAGRAIAQATPPGSVLAAPPSMDWLRLKSRRAIVADCKAVPYGGRPWREYQERMVALGGRDCATAASFAALDLTQLRHLRDRFGATHAVLAPDDPKLAGAEAAGWVVTLEATRPDAGGYVVVEIPASG